MLVDLFESKEMFVLEVTPIYNMTPGIAVSRQNDVIPRRLDPTRFTLDLTGTHGVRYRN